MSSDDELPEEIAELRDACVASVLLGEPLPDGFGLLTGWLQQEHADELYGDDALGVAIPIAYWQQQLTDDHLREARSLGDDVPLDDALRVAHARDVLAEIAEDPDPDECATLGAYRIEREDGEAAYLGYGLTGQGLADTQIRWWGAYASVGDFLDAVRAEDHVLSTEAETVGAHVALAAWD